MGKGGDHIAPQLRLGEGRCGRDDLAACRAGLQEVLDVARADGLVWPRSLERLARRLIAGEPGDWPAALRLARTAHALAPCSASWTLQASALGAAGRRTCAARLLARALLARPPAERGRVILRELVGLLSGLRHEHGMRDLALVLARARRRSTQRGAA